MGGLVWAGDVVALLLVLMRVRLAMGKHGFGGGGRIVVTLVERLGFAAYSRHCRLLISYSYIHDETYLNITCSTAPCLHTG
jgi:hypothetical protein